MFERREEEWECRALPLQIISAALGVGLILLPSTLHYCLNQHLTGSIIVTNTLKCIAIFLKYFFSYQPKQQFINSLALGSPISHKSISVQFICLHILYYVAFDLDGETDGLTDRQSPKSLLDVLIWSHW